MAENDDSKDPNTSVEVIITEVSLSLNSSITNKKNSGKYNPSSRQKTDILAIATSKHIKELALDKETTRIDSRFQNTTKPSDLGDHDPIPADCIIAIATVAEEVVDSVEVDEENE